MTDSSSHDDALADADGTELTHDESEALLDGTDADTSDRSASLDELFDRPEGDDLDGERLWDQLEADSSNASDAGVTRQSADRELREVEKRSYCHQCEHFAEPPVLACTRDGSEILAVTTMSTFRVADCPFVLEDEALERAE